MAEGITLVLLPKSKSLTDPNCPFVEFQPIGQYAADVSPCPKSIPITYSCFDLSGVIAQSYFFLYSIVLISLLLVIVSVYVSPLLALCTSEHDCLSIIGER